MNLTSAIQSLHARIVPASKANKVTTVERDSDGSMNLQFGDGSTGKLSKDDEALQAFVLWTMINSECTK